MLWLCSVRNADDDDDDEGGKNHEVEDDSILKVLGRWKDAFFFLCACESFCVRAVRPVCECALLSGLSLQA